MDLSRAQIKELIRGALSWEEDESGMIPLRFTAKQMTEIARSEHFIRYSRTSTGIRLACETDAAHLEAEFSVFPGSTRGLWGFDLYADDTLISHSEGLVSECSEVHLAYDIPAGSHTIDLYFPVLTGAKIKRISLSGATFARPVKLPLLICFGDSITNGFYVHFPSLSYPGILARKLGRDLINFGIAGYTFHPDLVDPDLTGMADLIFTALGTNDWTAKDLPAAKADAQEFYKRVVRIASGAKIFALTPIWRADCAKTVQMSISFESWRSILSDIASGIPEIRTIDGASIFPEITELFDDHVAHPNDIGNILFAEKLLSMPAINELAGC